ncbi:MAG: hypothetical protein IKN38_02385 [Clostridia bacterium]|nr:hypothetical protein [Clostridia bacterium]
MKYKDEKIERICKYCERAGALVNTDIVLCEKRGIVSAAGSCRKFIFDPLKYVPPKNAKIKKLEYVDIDDIN